MVKLISSYVNDFAHLFFPHNCAGCSTDILENDTLLCARCLQQLPETDFFEQPGNPVEKKFYGRLQVEAAGSAYYFTKESLLQHLVKELKYHGNKDAGFYLGKLSGNLLMQSKRFDGVDMIVPLPLNVRKERKRGYNQAAIICDGIVSVWNKRLSKNATGRSVFTETQTHKDRISRWKTMEGVFVVNDAPLLEGRHILLVDDVITTGATLEACGQAILNIPGTKLSIATVAYTI